jgi:hypothetical protein
MNLTVAVLGLVGSTLLVALCSEYLVDAIEGVSDSWGYARVWLDVVNCLLNEDTMMMMMMMTPIWPTWAVAALFRSARCIRISRGIRPRIQKKKQK